MKARKSFIWPEVLMMKEFVDKQNSLVENFKNSFGSEVGVYLRKDLIQCGLGDGGEIVDNDIRFVGSLSEEDWDLEEIFLEIMPAYFLASSLMAVWSVFEKEMERMYEYVSNQYFDGRKLAKKRSNISKIDHLSDSLKDFGLGRNISEELDEAIGCLNDEVRLVRNAWAHNGGEDAEGRLGNNVDGITIKQSKIIISPAYIERVVRLMEIAAKSYNDEIYRFGAKL